MPLRTCLSSDGLPQGIVHCSSLDLKFGSLQRFCESIKVNESNNMCRESAGYLDRITQVRHTITAQTRRPSTYTIRKLLQLNTSVCRNKANTHSFSHVQGERKGDVQQHPCHCELPIATLGTSFRSRNHFLFTESQLGNL